MVMELMTDVLCIFGFGMLGSWVTMFFESRLVNPSDVLSMRGKAGLAFMLITASFVL